MIEKGEEGSEVTVFKSRRQLSWCSGIHRQKKKKLSRMKRQQTTNLTH